MKKAVLTVIVVILACSSSFADAKTKNQIGERRFSVSASYFGDMVTHPGALLGAGYFIYSNSWFDLQTNANLGMYRHIKYQIAAFVDAELGARTTAKFGLFGDLAGGIGYLHSWPDGNIYTINDNGNLTEETNTGNPNLMVSAHTGFGWDLSRNCLKPISIFAYAWIFGEYPQNTAMVMHLALQIGASYAF